MAAILEAFCASPAVSKECASVTFYLISHIFAVFALHKLRPRFCPFSFFLSGLDSTTVSLSKVEKIVQCRVFIQLTVNSQLNAKRRIGFG